MPRIVDYPDVLRQAETLGLRCVYYNTGAFGFPAGRGEHVVGWLGPPDPTIRPEMLAQGVRVPPPYPANLATRLGRAWPGVIGGEAWLMPKSHWAFELDHGHGEWLGPALTRVGIDPAGLLGRADGSAIIFEAGESGLTALIETLLERLKLSDFGVLFPDSSVLLTVHHHQQLWWQTSEPTLHQALRDVGSAG